MLVWCVQDSSTAPLRLMPAALRFIPMELRMLKNDHVHPDSSRMLKNGHDSTHGAAKNEPDPATAELRFRPRTQSTTIHPECFKRFRIVLALSGRFTNRQDSPRIITVLLRFMPIYIPLNNRASYLYFVFKSICFLACCGFCLVYDVVTVLAYDFC